MLEFRETNKDEHTEFYKLARVIYSIPPTEVQIERDYSRLNNFFSNRRCMLQSERWADVMIININQKADEMQLAIEIIFHTETAKM